VRPAARPDARHLLLAVELLRPQPVRPYASGVDHVGGAELELTAAERVVHQHPGGATVALDQAGDLAGIRDHGSEALGLRQHGQH
jgi:hypothetical protein